MTPYTFFKAFIQDFVLKGFTLSSSRNIPLYRQPVLYYLYRLACPRSHPDKDQERLAETLAVLLLHYHAERGQ
jgi:hypothetical protein